MVKWRIVYNFNDGLKTFDYESFAAQPAREICYSFLDDELCIHDEHFELSNLIESKQIDE